jgi:hypothetical protein
MDANRRRPALRSVGHGYPARVTVGSTFQIAITFLFGQLAYAGNMATHAQYAAFPIPIAQGLRASYPLIH